MQQTESSYSYMKNFVESIKANFLEIHERRPRRGTGIEKVWIYSREELITKGFSLIEKYKTLRSVYLGCKNFFHRKPTEHAILLLLDTDRMPKYVLEVTSFLSNSASISQLLQTLETASYKGCRGLFIHNHPKKPSDPTDILQITLPSSTDIGIAMKLAGCLYKAGIQYEDSYVWSHYGCSVVQNYDIRISTNPMDTQEIYLVDTSFLARIPRDWFGGLVSKLMLRK